MYKVAVSFLTMQIIEQNSHPAKLGYTYAQPIELDESIRNCCSPSLAGLEVNGSVSVRYDTCVFIKHQTFKRLLPTSTLIFNRLKPFGLHQRHSYLCISEKQKYCSNSTQRRRMDREIRCPSQKVRQSDLHL